MLHFYFYLKSFQITTFLIKNETFLILLRIIQYKPKQNKHNDNFKN